MLLFNFDLTQNFSSLTYTLNVVDEKSFNLERLLERSAIEDCPELSGLIILENTHSLESDLLCIVREQKRFSGERVYAILKGVLCNVARGTLASSDSKIVEQVIAYIREKYSRPITNRDISDSVNYYEFYVKKLMCRQTGMALHRYLNTVRVKNAEGMLIDTGLTVSEISEQCGFSSSSHFISIFKRSMGMLPNEYRHSCSGLI